MQIEDDMIDDSNDTAPIEKSNLPEFKFIDKANVANITTAVDLTNKISVPIPANNEIPL